MMDWQPWQRRILRAIRKNPTTLLSTPRGQGKSTMAAALLVECLTPSSPWFRPGEASYVVAGAIPQVRRTTWPLFRQLIADRADLRNYETNQGAHCVHIETGTRVEAVASNSDRALGIGATTPLVVGDEPASWGPHGEDLYDALRTSLGKPGAAMRLFMVGTKAPQADDGWWPQLLDAGSRPGRHVTVYSTPDDRWHHTASLRSANPLMWAFPESRRVLLEERDEAIEVPSKASAFKRFRCNLPGGDPEKMLVPLEVWREVLARSPRGAIDRPLVGIDLGTSPSWSAAVALWPSTGRMSAVALAPGLPSLDAQERRDRAPRGLYGRLQEQGALMVAHGRRAPKIQELVDVVLQRWQPRALVADRVRATELKDAVQGRCPISFRAARWSEASFDIGSFRRLALDGGLNVDPDAAGLLTYSIGAARVKGSDDGSLVRLTGDSGPRKVGRRDDPAAAAVLVAGLAARQPAEPTLSIVSC